jgi:hypothetical protein
MSALVDWATLHVPPVEADSAPSSALSYSSASHDGLTDAEWLESPVVPPLASACPVCPPATPAREVEQKKPRIESAEPVEKK